MSSVDIKLQVGDDEMSLDEYCNYITNRLAILLEPLNEVDASLIPSEAQREAFQMMTTLMVWAESFASTLRYDVQATHEDCPEHDNVAVRRIARTRDAVMGIELVDAIKHLAIYSYADEQRDYEEQQRYGEDVDNHVFRHIQKITAWVDARDMSVWD